MKNAFTSLASCLLVALFLQTRSLVPAHAADEVVFCLYRTDNGDLKRAASRYGVPRRYRSMARCGTEDELMGNTNLAAPQEMELKGSELRRSFDTSLGRVNLRAPRSIENYFGKNPYRAVQDAARTVGRTIRQPGFSDYGRTLYDLEWNIVYFTADVTDGQIPTAIAQGCHPGFMTAQDTTINIYVDADMVAKGCGGSVQRPQSVADSELAHVLLHEMGHAVEHHLLGRNGMQDRLVSEGFATYFAYLAAGSSTLVQQSKLRKEIIRGARAAIEKSPTAFNFQGSAEDYARAALYFLAVAERKNLRGLTDVYALMNREGLNFFQAVEKRHGWDRQKLEEEARRLLS